MLHDLAAQKSTSALTSRLRRYTTPTVLAIDEVGYLSYDARYADLFFEVVSHRYLRGRELPARGSPGARRARGPEAQGQRQEQEMKADAHGGRHWRPAQIIAPDWTPEQALAVFTVIDQLRELICARYGPEIQDALHQEQGVDLPPRSDPPF